MRFDVPVIGLSTIDTMRACHVTALSISADKTLILDREETLAAAAAHRLSILAR
jgi:hypothetical protein